MLFRSEAIERLLYLNLKLEATKRLFYLDLNGVLPAKDQSLGLAFK